MAKKSRSTFQKYHKEQARQRKQQEKAARRLQAKQRRANGEPGGGDTTPDPASILLEPQPSPASVDGVSGQA